MRASKRELAYAAQNFNEVHHTTLNPEGPGVVRIHLVPPLVEGDEIAPSVAILNGQDGKDRGRFSVLTREDRPAMLDP